MKLVLKDIAIFLIVTILISTIFSTKAFIDLCNEYQLKIFSLNRDTRITEETKKILMNLK